MNNSEKKMIDTCLYKAGFKSEKNPSAIAGLFNEFIKTPPMLKNLAGLDLQEQSSINIWSCSGGECAEQSLFFVEFDDSTIEEVTPNPTVGFSEHCSENEGETLSECITRIDKKVNRVVHIVWNYSEWNDLERDRSITIYRA